MAMRICDLTMAYSETSGGIRTYIDHKRRYLREHTSHEHVLIVPGAEDRVESSDRAVTYCIKSPPTGHGTYRLLWRPDAILRALREATPDVVELGTFFVCPWPGLRYREERRAGGRRCITVGYFHTDLAEAYVEGPLADAVHDWLKPWGGAVEHLGLELAEVLGKGAERYFGAIFRRCDAMLAATPDEAARLAEYGIDAPHVIPLGVDLEAFTPQRRDPALRERFGASEDSCIMIYAGRLDAEKHVDVLLEVLSLLLARGVDARLVLVGDGPLKEQLAARARELQTRPSVRLSARSGGARTPAGFVRRVRYRRAVRDLRAVRSRGAGERSARGWGGRRSTAGPRRRRDRFSRTCRRRRGDGEPCPGCLCATSGSRSPRPRPRRGALQLARDFRAAARGLRGVPQAQHRRAPVASATPGRAAAGEIATMRRCTAPPHRNKAAWRRCGDPGQGRARAR
jgi:glycosyltransferase involved in cell wall biosynthesis